MSRWQANTPDPRYKAFRIPRGVHANRQSNAGLLSARALADGTDFLTDNTALPGAPAGQLALLGPAEKLDAAHWPVRGDLAHVRLAGRCFVPHYAVPMPHRLAVATPLRRTASECGESLADLAAGARFDVLDIAGGWVWGQAGEDGFVGYLPLAVVRAEPGAPA